MLNPRMTQRAVRTDCKQLRLDLESKLLPNKDENEDSTDLAPWVLCFESMPLQMRPDFTRISLAYHRQSIYPSGSQRYP
jgi:hypothetical protein